MTVAPDQADLVRVFSRVFSRVVSAEQIPLEHEQWSVDGEHWTEVSADLIARLVRAAGHRGSEVPDASDVVELHDVGWVDGNRVRWQAVEAIRETGSGASEIILST